jgi:hypothetical protein
MTSPSRSRRSPDRPGRVVHTVRNVGTGTATELATYVVETGKSLLTVAQ